MPYLLDIHRVGVREEWNRSRATCKGYYLWNGSGTEGELSASAAIYDSSGATGMLDMSAMLLDDPLNGLYALPLESKRGMGENKSCEVLVSCDPSILSLRDSAWC